MASHLLDSLTKLQIHIGQEGALRPLDAAGLLQALPHLRGAIRLPAEEGDALDNVAMQAHVGAPLPEVPTPMGEELFAQGYVIGIGAGNLGLVQLAVPLPLVVHQQIVKVPNAEFGFVQIEQLVHLAIAEWPQDIGGVVLIAIGSHCEVWYGGVCFVWPPSGDWPQTRTRRN